MLRDRPLVCPRLVGREAQVATIERLLDAAAARRGQVLVVAGEAGVGKSRLVAEARASAAGRGFLALQGACFEPDRAFPYAPFLDLLRALPVASTADLVRFLGPTAHELARLLPELLPYLPEPPADLDPAQVRRRLFDALVQVAARAAALQPLLLVVEDLHWADPTSLELLAFLAARIGALPALLLVTHRTDDASPALDHLLAELDRGRLATELTLGRLDRAGVGAMVRAILHPEVPPAPFVDAIAALTDGNPFFVEESLKAVAAEPAGWDALPAESRRIPRTVSDAVTRRIEQLSGAARQLLDLAAVAGRRFDFAVLPAVTGLDEATSVAAVRELIRAQLVVEEAADRLAFRHALTRQAVYGRLLGRERREMHRRIAEALEGLRVGGDAAVSDLAYHYHAAGAWGSALEHGRAAGEAAQRLHAHGAAVEHFTRALEAAGQLGAAPSPDLLRARSRSRDNVGNFAGARADLEAALATALAAGDRSGQMATLLELGQLWTGRDYVRAGECFEQALVLARAIDDSVAVARSLNRVGNWHLNLDRPDEASRRHAEALAIFERLHDQRGVAETLDLLGTATRLGAELGPARDYLTRAAVLWRALDDRVGLTGSLIGLTLCGPSYQTATMAATLPSEAALRAGEEALQLASAVGWRAGEAYALTFLAFALGPSGQYGRALELGRAALALAEEIEHRQWRTAAHCALGALRLDLLDPVGAIAQLEPGLALARESGSRHWINCASGFLASALIATRDRASAAAVLADVVPVGERPRTMGQRLTVSAAAELALAEGEPARALTTLSVLDADAAPRPALLRAAALTALDRVDEAAAALSVGLAAVEAVGNRSAEWRLRAALGLAERRRGRASEAEQALDGARATLAELAEALPEGRERFLTGAAALLPPRRAPSPRRVEAARFGGLTAREREVVALVASGLSNREIAEALVLGERTVETHVTNVRSKLGFVARTQIAAWAVEQGLTAPP